MAASEGGGGKGERAAGETIRNYKGKMEIIFAHVGVLECVESIRGRKKRGTQQAVEGRARGEEGKDNRMCLCMYAEVLTLQFDGRGRPVSERLAAVYQRELRRGDTVCAGVRRPPATRAEVATVFDWAQTKNPQPAFCSPSSPQAPAHDLISSFLTFHAKSGGSHLLQRN